MPRIAAFAFALIAVCLAGVSAVDARDVQPIKVGSKRFTESYILAELIAETARRGGERAEVKPGLGNTAIVYEALRSKAIDVYPEYAGTISREILKSESPLEVPEMNRRLAPLGLAVSVPLGFNNGYALAMRGDDAARRGVTKLSQLAAQPQLKLGLSNEFIGRADGWPGLAAAYKLPQSPIALDHGIAYDALAGGRIDATDVYTTDSKIASLGLAVLQDDAKHFPRYDALLLHRADAPSRFPGAWTAIVKLEGRIDEAAMIRMNGRAELEGVPFDAVARAFLDAAPGAAGSAPKSGRTGSRLWTRLFAGDLVRLLTQHIGLVAVSVLAGALIAIPLGIWAAGRARWSAVFLAVASLLQTVPSLALLAILISVLGMIGLVPALIALMLYSLLPILANTIAGLTGVPRGTRQAALALGMTRRQSLSLVEFPIALPVILAGVRTATVIAIGTATIAAFIGAGGLGERIVTGLALNDNALMLAGAIPVALLAIASELAFEAMARVLPGTKHRLLLNR